MRVGILTFHRAHNYGAVLQCYALQEVLKSLGHEVSVINYQQLYIDKSYAPKIDAVDCLRKIYHHRFGFLFLDIKKYVKEIRRWLNFYLFRKKYFNCTEGCNSDNIPQNLDCYIIGSDQVWSMHCTNGFDPVFWGQFERPHCSKLIGYAISSVGDFENVLNNEQILIFLRSFNEISFRESSFRDQITKITGFKKKISLDPTLLTTADTWSPLLSNKWKRQRFVVLYQVRNIENRPGLLKEKAYNLARELGCQVLDLSNRDFPVTDFVSSIRYAECVVTSSFHGTVFSILFGTPFYTFRFNDCFDDRFVGLLKSLGLEDHLADENTEMRHPKPIENQEDVKKRLDMMRAESLNFLSSINEI